MDNCPEKPALPAHPWDRSILNRLSDGLIQLAAAEGSRGGRGTKSPLPAKERSQPLSKGRLALFLRSYCRRGCVSPEGGRVTSSACALAKAKVVKNLVSGLAQNLDAESFCAP